MTDLSAISAPRVLAIIPARGGSKGLPGKNLMRVGGQTLLARSVSCAKAAGVFARIVVSTDDPAIAEEGRRAGAEVPFLRPVGLATDTANVRDAVVHLLGKLRATEENIFHIVVLLEPTSPARTPEIVRQTVAACAAEGSNAAFTASEVPLRYHPLKQFHRDEQGFAAFAHPDGATVVNRQQLKPTFIRNGMCYAVRTSALDAGLGLTGSAARLILVNGPVINIDDQADLDLARQMLGP